MMVNFKNFKVSSILIKLIKIWTQGHHFPSQINTDHQRFLPYGTHYIVIFDVTLYQSLKEQRKIKADLYFVVVKNNISTYFIRGIILISVNNSQ